MNIPLAQTDIGQAERAAIERVAKSGRLARGAEIESFEKEFAQWHGVAAAAMTSSGTGALACVLRALGIGVGTGASDEVIIPAFAFVGVANAVFEAGAIPVVVDVDEHSGNLNPTKVASAVTDNTKAVVLVHTFGRAADVEELRAVIPEIPIIEDAAEAIGSELHGQRVGTFGTAGIFGFYPNKLLTTGEGGIVISNDEDLIERCRTLANQGGPDTGPGFSMRANELAAAIGRAQLTTLEDRLVERMAIAAEYQSALAKQGREVFGYDTGVRSWFTCPVRFDAPDEIQGKLAECGIDTARYFPALHTLETYRSHLRSAGALETSELLAAQMLSLPLWPGITPHIPHICDSLRQA